MVTPRRAKRVKNLLGDIECVHGSRDYIGHGIRARAQDLVTLELGPEQELERIVKLTREVAQERFTLLGRTLLVRAKEGVLAITTDDEGDHRRHALRVG
jgi:type IV secretory pathway VirD2 relaxase